jgi:hypothetical protein
MSRLNLTVLLATISMLVGPMNTRADDLLQPKNGWEFGLQVSEYEYEEPDFAKLDGPRLGATLAYTRAPKGPSFLRFDGRVSAGSLNYEGSGTQSDVPDYIVEMRLTGGKGFRTSSTVSLAPYAGLGYRFLYNDNRGTSSTGAIGYRRYSNYLYVPVGLTFRAQTSSKWVLATTLEYDVFLAGRQVSTLSDTGPGYSDITNDQDNGYGYRIYLMAETDTWAIGPWVHYWDVEDSDTATDSNGTTWLEPANTTLEYGLELRRRF